ncbi:MAG TPA: argininosuccinate lyase, partial [Chromatiales bacterium]|nr:argininosuccinate lyase [Chromatiales bacterium]
GKAVRLGVTTRRDLSEMSLEELQGFDARIGADVFEVLTLEGSVAARDIEGGTAPSQVRRQIAAARERLGL